MLHTPNDPTNASPFRRELEQPFISITLDNYPASFDELVRAVNALGHRLEVVPFEHAGERTFGHLERVVLDDVDCVVRYAGSDQSEMFIVCATAVQQERDGLHLARGLATPLVAEIRVDGQVVAVFRAYAEGESLPSAIKDGAIEPSEARAQVEKLVDDLTKSGLRLWDCNPENVWRRPDGTLMILEGQCVIPSTFDSQQELVEANTFVLNVMFPRGPREESTQK